MSDALANAECQRCQARFAPTERIVNSGGELYHEHCFVCAQCFRPFPEGLFYEVRMLGVVSARNCWPSCCVALLRTCPPGARPWVEVLPSVQHLWALPYLVAVGVEGGRPAFSLLWAGPGMRRLPSSAGSDSTRDTAKALVFEGRKYCEHDFQMLFAPCCGSCGEFIVGRVIKAMNNNWHPACFRCELCEVELADLGFVKNAGRQCSPLGRHSAWP
ncbi:LIM and senescent cell antigen-like-containing domain protein 2 [Tupaia chinensis]|uniref:LIM and senescent cell antigen-like-containing domain protein 2 n=1 Tax=Tupaia chinensis TaxID=246437 RepID=L9KH15_TUPCH|nr:LIM and senescent cell antigen-like-containing domain protein 2 [Tupaia chinensis]